MSEQQRQDRPPRKNGRPQQPGNGGMRFGRGLFGWVLFIALAVMLFMLLNKNQTQYSHIAFSDFMSRLEADKVAELTIEGDKVHGEFRGTETIGEKGEGVGKFQTDLPTGAINWDFVRDIYAKRGSAKIKIENNQNIL